MVSVGADKVLRGSTKTVHFPLEEPVMEGKN